MHLSTLHVVYLDRSISSIFSDWLSVITLPEYIMHRKRGIQVKKVQLMLSQGNDPLYSPLGCVHDSFCTYKEVRYPVYFMYHGIHCIAYSQFEKWKWLMIIRREYIFVKINFFKEIFIKPFCPTSYTYRYIFCGMTHFVLQYIF